MHKQATAVYAAPHQSRESKLLLIVWLCICFGPDESILRLTLIPCIFLINILFPQAVLIFSFLLLAHAPYFIQTQRVKSTFVTVGACLSGLYLYPTTWSYLGSSVFFLERIQSLAVLFPFRLWILIGILKGKLTSRRPMQLAKIQSLLLSQSDCEGGASGRNKCLLAGIQIHSTYVLSLSFSLSHPLCLSRSLTHTHCLIGQHNTVIGAHSWAAVCRQCTHNLTTFAPKEHYWGQLFSACKSVHQHAPLDLRRL